MRNGGYYVTGTRVSLDTLVYLYRDGASPEGIQDELPSLALEQIHGALAFYLANRKSVDENIAEGEREFLPSAEEAEITPETAEALDRARASLARGEGIPHEEILREFGLTK